MSEQPNIVLILVDDMGYSDLGCYGGEVRTPNLDGLAARGVRFTHAYNCARCCPARASLMTGLYPHQAGMGWMTAADLGSAGYVGDLNTRCLTIAEALAPAGYRSYIAGKWHLTQRRCVGPDGPKHSWPMQRGFERFFGTLVGSSCYWKPDTLCDGNTQIEPPENTYYTDAISDAACRFIADHCRDLPGRPFFQYVAYSAPHWPLHAWPQDIARCRGRFRRGWDVLRAEKFRRMLDMGLLHDRWRLSPRDPLVPAWDTLTPGQQDVFDLRMAIYAAQLECMDRGVGRILRTIEQAGRRENTLVLFLSDNGGCHEEVHFKDPDPATFGAAASYESYGRGWANHSNVPFREFKSWVHEGGIATPMIAHWPAAGIDSGRFCHEPCHITDIMPTCLDVAGATYDPPAHRDAWPLVGKSLMPAFAARAIERDCIFWEHEANRALSQGKWKIVAKGLDGPWELYDMDVDRTEQNDLSARDGQRVAAMAAKWRQIAEETLVYPLDGRDWDARTNIPMVP